MKRHNIMEKTYKAEQKFLLMSPRKIRPVVATIKKMKPAEAVARLPFVQRRAGAEIAKVIKAAMASAKAAGVSETDLVFAEIRVGEGPRLKRGIAVSRGQWHPIKKRMSHIRVLLKSVKVEKPEAKKEEAKPEVKITKEVAVKENKAKKQTK